MFHHIHWREKQKVSRLRSGKHGEVTLEKKIPIELHKKTYIKFGPLFAFAQGDKCQVVE